MYINPVCGRSGDAILDYLCKVKEGKFNSLPKELEVIVWDGQPICGKKAVGVHRVNKEGCCAVCGIESIMGVNVLDWHHIRVTDLEKPLMSDGEHYWYYLGLIRLCCNHHAVVSRGGNNKSE